MEFFLGQHEYTIDGNNRLSIPAKFRKVMEELDQAQFIVSKIHKDYLVLIPYGLWKETIGDKIKQTSRGEKANRLRRLVGSKTTEVSLDKQGRIIIPTDYYQHADIDKKILIVGAVDTIQLWNPDQYSEISSSPEEQSVEEELLEFQI